MLCLQALCPHWATPKSFLNLTEWHSNSLMAFSPNKLLTCRTHDSYSRNGVFRVVGGCTSTGIITAEKIVFLKTENPGSMYT